MTFFYPPDLPLITVGPLYTTTIWYVGQAAVYGHWAYKSICIAIQAEGSLDDEAALAALIIAVYRHNDCLYRVNNALVDIVRFLNQGLGANILETWLEQANEPRGVEVPA